MSRRTRQIHLVRRPQGLAQPSDFALVEAELPELRDGQVLVENLWMSVDPYMRRSMGEAATDLEPWPLDRPLDGPSVGRVLESRSPGFAVGDIVESLSGWQEHFIASGGGFVPYLSPSDTLVRRTAVGAEPRDYVGLLGVAALAAYRGMAVLARGVAGGTAVLSSGAGTVGAIGCQLAKLRGMRVVASAGTDEKVRWLTDVAGVDVAFNYRREPYAAALRRACPRGIDVVLESVGPEHLAACLPLMNELGQVLIAGMICMYSTGGAARLDNFEWVLDRYVTIQPYRFMDSLDVYDRFVDDMLRWRREGQMRVPEVVFEGIERAPQALCSLFTGGHIGKPLVRLERTMGGGR